ncbi:hypothetical protein, partial [Micromonospora chersina]|uniref:hypothetical protein n=1 Tax=Micromonospora chersina TaxID=47854 RepID=UPI0033CE8317
MSDSGQAGAAQRLRHLAVGRRRRPAAAPRPRLRPAAVTALAPAALAAALAAAALASAALAAAALA